MQKKFSTFLILLMFAAISTSYTACKAKEGCGLEEQYGAPTDRSGNLSTKGGKSNLFDKKTRKKMRQR